MTAKRISLLILLTTFTLLLSGCSVRKTSRETEGSALAEASRDVFTMGTVFSAVLYTDPSGGLQAEEVLSDAVKELMTADNLLSWRIEDSLAWQFNEKKSADVSAAAELVSRTLDVCRKSQGALDITVLPLSRLWNFDKLADPDFDPDSMEVPEEDAIREALAHVGYEGLIFDEESSILSAEDDKLSLEMGAVGKGYAIDQTLEKAKEEGASGMLLSAGSSIGMFGTKPDGSLFRVALRDPRGSQSDYLGVLTLSDCTVSTSGDYERYFEKDGVRYHHILDPHTGYPADSGLMQVTIISENAALGDALSTACFVLGLEKGMLLAKEYNVLAFFVDKEKNIWYNDSDILDSLDFTGNKAGYNLSGYPE